MTAMTPDAPRSAIARGIPLALIACASFGLSGSLARGLMDIGWTAGAATIVRVTVAAIFMIVPGILSMRGRWHLLRKGAAVIVVYGVLAVAAAQLFYFLAVARLDVGVALLVEYTAPIAVVLWLWARHGNRPTRVTVIGAVIAAVGLVLLLDIIGGQSIDLVGVAWALGAMVGAAAYFVMGADESNGLPPIALAAGGVAVASVVLITAALTGVLPFAMTTGDVAFRGVDVPWWVVALALGVVTAGLSYVAGIAATRALGARLASFVSLVEVIAAATFAWLLLGQTPLPIQMAGAALVLAGVIVVKVGEPAIAIAALDTMMVPLEDVQLDVDSELAELAEMAEMAELAELAEASWDEAAAMPQNHEIPAFEVSPEQAESAVY